MDIIPAIDLRNGQCVRLTRGDFSQIEVYERDPILQALRFAQAGAQWLHIVDLDGAREGGSRQRDIIERMAQSVPLKLQVGGGIRDEIDLKALLDRGIERVVIGSLAVQAPARVRDWLRRFGSARIAVALDVRPDERGEPRVLTQAWQKETGTSLWALLDIYENDGLKTVLCTDVGRDGMLAGPNLELYRRIHSLNPKLELLASGGVRNVDDLNDLAQLGISGAIIGKAIYAGHVDLAGAIMQVKHAC
jgi:phosphoribosylformimino-5-aminoimidazole carboxamide ribotide isomerase